MTKHFETLFASVFILTSAVLFSYCPQVTWNHGHPATFPSSYSGQSFTERVPSIFNKWDVLRYTGIAVKGYPADDRSGLAFFPTWPWLLRGIAWLTGADQAALGLLAIPINIVLWTLALHTWLSVFDRIPFLAESPRWASQDRTRFAWLFAFYPSTLFCVVGYLESGFLLVMGRIILAVQRDEEDRLLWLFPILISLKHVGMLAGASVLGWMLVFRRLRSPRPLLGYVLGLGIVFGYYGYYWHDPLVWAKVQAGWGRHLAWPHELILDTRGRGAELILYAVFAFVGPALLLRRTLVRRAIIRQPENWLPWFYCVGILAPIWFGGSIQSIYRALYLVPFLFAVLPALFSERGNSWSFFLGFSVLMNLHATYRYVQNLFIN